MRIIMNRYYIIYYYMNYDVQRRDMYITRSLITITSFFCIINHSVMKCGAGINFSLKFE